MYDTVPSGKGQYLITYGKLGLFKCDHMLCNSRHVI